MRSVPLGNTGLMVSEVGFGGIPLTRVAPQVVEPLLRRALELGFRFFDTARMYGDSEEKLGRGLAGRREKVVLASKTMAREGGKAAAELETTLANLRTDYLDLYQLHNVAKPEVLSQVMAPGGALEAVEKARDQGKVRHIGFSSHHPDIALQAMATGRFATVQFACNFVEDAASGRVFAEARERGMGCIAMKPLGGGLLERADLCFGWLRGREGVVPIPGIQSIAEAEEIAALCAAPPKAQRRGPGRYTAHPGRTGHLVLPPLRLLPALPQRGGDPLGDAIPLPDPAFPARGGHAALRQGHGRGGRMPGLRGVRGALPLQPPHSGDDRRVPGRFPRFSGRPRPGLRAAPLCYSPICLEATMRMMSLVPPPIMGKYESRRNRCAGYSFISP